jgi:hypothetical protein
MKCVCGYEQQEDFEQVNIGGALPHTQEVWGSLSFKRIRACRIHICPKCGTLKIVKETVEESLR